MQDHFRTATQAGGAGLLNAHIEYIRTDSNRFITKISVVISAYFLNVFRLPLHSSDDHLVPSRLAGRAYAGTQEPFRRDFVDYKDLSLPTRFKENIQANINSSSFKS